MCLAKRNSSHAALAHDFRAPQASDNAMKKLTRFALCAILLAAPATLTLAGCGGGSNKPAIPEISRTDRFTLSNGQNAVLVTRPSGLKLTGTLQILNEPTQQSAELPVGLPLGTYDLVGSFAAPRGFDLVGTFPNGRDKLTLSGQLPLPNVEGSYALSYNDVVVRGIIPALKGSI